MGFIDGPDLNNCVYCKQKRADLITCDGDEETHRNRYYGDVRRCGARACDVRKT